MMKSVYPTVLLLFTFSFLIEAQVQVRPRLLRGNQDQSCPSTESLDSARARYNNQIRGILEEDVLPRLCQIGRYEDNPASSCAEIHSDCPSDYYWILGSDDEPKLVYCISNTQCCSNRDYNDRKWMQIANLNMSNPAENCPNDWRLVQDPVRSCRRALTSFNNSVFYSSNGIPYSRVCGRITGYQYGTPEGFAYYHDNSRALNNLNNRYVDGISVTYGEPRNHVWTFVGGSARSNTHMCPCSNPSQVINIRTPPFISGEYFCEVGTNASSNVEGRFFPDNPLWDGQGCTGTSECCSYNNPPWFCKQLADTTTEDIEVRTLTYASPSLLELEDTPVELIQIYVQ